MILNRQPGRAARRPCQESPRDENAQRRLRPGDTVVFSSRAIPGNEKPIITMSRTDWWSRASTIVTDNGGAGARFRPSPPQRAAAECLPRPGRRWSVPVHGEAAHLVAQGEACTANPASRPAGRPGCATAISLRLAPGCSLEVIGEAPHGRIYKDGDLIGDFDEDGYRASRRKLSFAGHVTVSVLLDERYDFSPDDPEVVTHRPGRNSDG